jgi:hypothetical protein
MVSLSSITEIWLRKALLGMYIGNRLLEAQIWMRRNIINGENIIISIIAEIIKDIKGSRIRGSRIQEHRAKR